MSIAPGQLDRMREHAAEAASVLRLIGNENRLIILCSLVEGEMGVGALREKVTLSQSALSQHLTKLREDKLIAARRDGLNIYYHISSDKFIALISALADIFGPDEIRTVKRK